MTSSLIALPLLEPVTNDRPDLPTADQFKCALLGQPPLPLDALAQRLGCSPQTVLRAMHEQVDVWWRCEQVSGEWAGWRYRARPVMDKRVRIAGGNKMFDDSGIVKTSERITPHV